LTAVFINIYKALPNMTHNNPVEVKFTAKLHNGCLVQKTVTLVCFRFSYTSSNGGIVGSTVFYVVHARG
jgi:hypothetical protein